MVYPSPYISHYFFSLLNYLIFLYFFLLSISFLFLFQPSVQRFIYNFYTSCIFPLMCFIILLIVTSFVNYQISFSLLLLSFSHTSYFLPLSLSLSIFSATFHLFFTSFCPLPFPCLLCVHPAMPLSLSFCLSVSFLTCCALSLSFCLCLFA